MGTTLSGIGFFWAFVSMITATLTSTGYYLPYWLHGTMYNSTDVYFGTFRRCNYPKVSDTGSVVIVEECGRYTSFSDIPSLSWQICTILIGVGCGLLLLVGFTTVFACCISDVVSKGAARVGGGLQLLAGMLIAAGCGLYPHGWNSREVKEACGMASDAYKIGTCFISWSYYMVGIGVILALICFCVSFKATKGKSSVYTARV